MRETRLLGVRASGRGDGRHLDYEGKDYQQRDVRMEFYASYAAKSNGTNNDESDCGVAWVLIGDSRASPRQTLFHV